jgi:hypothetical protein
MSVLSTSPVYWAVFQLLSGCNLAGNQPNMISINTSILSITNVYDFFDNSSASYAQYGFGALFNSVPLPVKYNNPDVQLLFPLTYGEKDSCDYSYSISIPSFGYYGESDHRVNFVDGWGTVITPGDTFSAMRVLSVITAHDSIYSDTLGIGLPFNYTTTEYKWYANTMGEPVIKISVRSGTGAGTTADFRYKPRNTAGITDLESPIACVDLYPNPASENTELHFSLVKSSQVEFSITDILGRNIKTIAGKEYLAGFNSVPLDISGMNLCKGIYFVRVSSGNSSKVIKMEVF